MQTVTNSQMRVFRRCQREHHYAYQLGYRTREEIEEWRGRDPIKRFRETLTSAGRATEQELEEIDAAVRTLVEEAHTFALNSPEPDPTTVLDYVHSAG